ncbi:hypothetical protein CSHISOI_09202, partial [Colletotrichum shisoi]
VAVGQLLDVPSIYPCVGRRFHYGELRLSRLNKISSIWKTPLCGYMSRWNQYGSFFGDNFALLASSTVYPIDGEKAPISSFSPHYIYSPKASKPYYQGY